MNPLKNKRIVLGVSGSIACYKSADLASKLAQSGALVDVILTESAQNFVTPLTFQSVTGRRAYTDADMWGSEAHVLHVGLAHEADLLAIVPATANTITKLACGLSNTLLTVTALAATCPLVVAPAMDGGMFTHPTTQQNLATLGERGALVIGPESGHLASGLVAMGRMSEPLTILGQMRHLLAQAGPQASPLAGRKVVVTAGGTRESLDPVRFITNHSSGRQGFALAQAALDAGANVTLVTTASLPTPTGATRVDVDSAQQMADAVLAECRDADVLLMAAAVGDFRPAQMATQKIKKGGGELDAVELLRNPDILVEVKQQREQIGRPDIVVGFAAETENLLANAHKKVLKKGLDFIVANDVSAPDAGFGVATNRVTILNAAPTAEQFEKEELPLMSKEAVAERVIERVVDLLVAKSRTRHDYASARCAAGDMVGEWRAAWDWWDACLAAAFAGFVASGSAAACGCVGASFVCRTLFFQFVDHIDRRTFSTQRSPNGRYLCRR